MYLIHLQSHRKLSKKLQWLGYITNRQVASAVDVDVALILLLVGYIPCFLLVGMTVGLM